MKREVVCQGCQGSWEKLIEKNPGEEIRVVKGTLKFEYVCDSCNEGLPPGAFAAAVSVSTKRTPYSPWERDYLVLL